MSISVLMARSIISDAESVPTTFSSWHNCMKKAYCKWPAIVGIIIASLIVVSVLFCLVQCLCCGVSCAKMLCCCCRGCRGWGGGGGGGRRSRSPKGDYSQMPPAPYGGYQPPAAQMAWANGGQSTATFDVSKKGTEDSLPVMPSWDNARTHRVEEAGQPEHKHGDDLEMGQLGPQQSGRVSRGDGYSQVPIIEGPRSPTLPAYHQPGYVDPSTHAYGSDLGAQQPTYQAAGNYGRSSLDQQHPMSPAPTYHTYPTAPANYRGVAGVGGAAAGGAAAGGGVGGRPASRFYYNNNSNNGALAQPSSYAPSTNTSTLYEQTHPPSLSEPRLPNLHEETVYDNAYNNNNNTTSYFPPQDAQQHPTQLQVGRKAIPGSVRDV